MADCYYHGPSSPGPCPECQALRAAGKVPSIELIAEEISRMTPETKVKKPETVFQALDGNELRNSRDIDGGR